MRTILLGIFLIIHLNVNAQDFTVTDSLIVNNETNQAQLILRFSEELKVPENKADSLPFSFYVLNPPDSISILNSVHTVRNDSSIVEITFSITPDSYFSAVILDAQNLDGFPLTEPYFINFDSYSPESKPAIKSIPISYHVLAPLTTSSLVSQEIYLAGVIRRNDRHQNLNLFLLNPDSINSEFQSIYVYDRNQINSFKQLPLQVVSAQHADSISVLSYVRYNSTESSFSDVFVKINNEYLLMSSIASSSINYYNVDLIEDLDVTFILDTRINEQKSDRESYSFKLTQAYPNPFNPSTQLKVEVIQTSELVLHVYDVLGRKVKSWQTQQRFTSGQHEIALDFSGFASGTYVVELIGTDLASGIQSRQTTKVSLVK